MAMVGVVVVLCGAWLFGRRFQRPWCRNTQKSWPGRAPQSSKPGSSPCLGSGSHLGRPGAVGGFGEIRKWPPFQGTVYSGAGKSNPWPWSCTCSTTEPPALSEITFPLSPHPFTLPPSYFSLFETWSHTVAQAGLEFTV